MPTTLATITSLPVRPTARPGDRLRCTPGQPERADFLTLMVCHTAFWRRKAQSRRYSNVVRDVRRRLDADDYREGLTPDPSNHASARRWVDHAIAATGSPLTVVPR